MSVRRRALVSNCFALNAKNAKFFTAFVILAAIPALSRNPVIF
jgi:hypothetical protein